MFEDAKNVKFKTFQKYFNNNFPFINIRLFFFMEDQMENNSEFIIMNIKI